MSTISALSGSRDASQVENLRSRFGPSWDPNSLPARNHIQSNTALQPKDSIAQGMCDPLGPSSVEFGSWMAEGQMEETKKKSRTGRKSKARKSRRSKKGAHARKGRKSRRGGKARRSRASRRRRAA